jgi:hypothetical protein
VIRLLMPEGPASQAAVPVTKTDRRLYGGGLCCTNFAFGVGNDLSQCRSRWP